MIQQQKNRIKAFILLSVFSLNTVVGFACSVGVDMGFNSKHHHDEEATKGVVHIHADGKKHVHYEKKENHNNDKSHHNKDKNHHKSKDDKDNCCNDQVLKFEQLDKSFPQSAKIIHPTFLIAHFDAFYDSSLPDPGIIKNIKQFVRSYHPPISNIRIAIQSFQI